MVDLSWSMALRGSFQAAKKVALALNNLIGSKFTRDSLYIVGFSAYARRVEAGRAAVPELGRISAGHEHAPRASSSRRSCCRSTRWAPARSS